MNNYLSREMIIYLFKVLGLDESTIELGIKLSIKNNTPLPICLLYTSPSPRDVEESRMPSSA